MPSYTPSRGHFAGQTFTSYRQYKNALAQQRGYGSLYQQQRAARLVRGVQELGELSPAERAARDRALEAVARMRRDPTLSLGAAAHAASTTPNTNGQSAPKIAPAAPTARGGGAGSKGAVLAFAPGAVILSLEAASPAGPTGEPAE